MQRLLITVWTPQEVVVGAGARKLHPEHMPLPSHRTEPLPRGPDLFHLMTPVGTTGEADGDGGVAEVMEHPCKAWWSRGAAALSEEGRTNSGP